MNSVSGSCSSNTYYDDCASVSGERVWKTGHTKRTSYIISGSSVTSCGRYRTESACNNCFGGSCVTTASTNYGGSTVTYSVISSSGKVASLPVNSDIVGSCENICTNTDGELVSATGETTCGDIGGWLVVNDSYDETCAVKQTCQEVEVKVGCEGSDMGSVAGTYRPLSPSSDECSSSVDRSRSIYKKSGSTDIYLFYAGSEWKFLKSFCSNLFVTGAAYFDGGDEPYLNAESRIQCYDGGNGSDKSYYYTDFSIQCKKKSGSSGTKLIPGSSGAKGRHQARFKFISLMTVITVVVMYAL